MRTIRETLRRIGLPVGVVVIMLSMLGFLAGPTASAQTGYPPPSDQVLSISGRVVDPITGAPVAFGVVSLYQCDVECFFTTSQNISADGQFKFNASYFFAPLFPGNYRVIVNAFGYDQFEGNIFPAAVGQNVELGDITIGVARFIAGISGRIVDATTAQAITGIGYPSFATLYRCNDGVCDTIEAVQSIFISDIEFSPSPSSANRPFYISPGVFVLELQVDRYQQLRTAPFSVSAGEFKGIGNIAMMPLPTIGSISGQIVDSVTGGPVPGGIDPGAEVSLSFCSSFLSCYFPVASQSADAFGRFHFDHDFIGRPLLAGEYRISVSADQYRSANPDAFFVDANENRDLGKVKLQPYPVRFTNMRGCDNISATGGMCQYSVRVTSGMTSTIDAASWSIVDAFSFQEYGTGTGGSSIFQTDQAQNLRLKPGQSQVLNFKFRVPAGTSVGTSMCMSAYVSKDASTRLFNTIGFRNLFCIVKTSDTGGFRKMTERERREHERQQRNGPGSRP